jgi:aspartyl protease family protein
VIERTVLARGLVILALSAAPAAWSQTVSLQGMLGNKALLIVDGGAPRSVAPGESWKGVKVLSTRGDEAMVEAGGRRFTMRVGEAPASVGAGGGGTAGGGRIVLSAESGGHFMANGAINGRAAYFMVDTGASMVGMSARDAERFGIDYKGGQPVRLNTANGIALGWRVKLSSVRVADVEVREVDAVVSQEGMPFVLLGNSFLTRFQMRRENDQMVLDRRY